MEVGKIQVFSADGDTTEMAAVLRLLTVLSSVALNCRPGYTVSYPSLSGQTSNSIHFTVLYGQPKV